MVTAHIGNQVMLAGAHLGLRQHFQDVWVRIGIFSITRRFRVLRCTSFFNFASILLFLTFLMTLFMTLLAFASSHSLMTGCFAFDRLPSSLLLQLLCIR